MRTLLEQPALSFDSEHHDVADLVLVGLLSGEWQSLEALVARGLGLEAERSEQVTATQLDDSLSAFRYERRLIAAAELQAWLSDRSLDLADLRGVLRRRLLRERFENIPCSPADVDEIAIVMRAEATCAGALSRYANELTAWHAGSRGLAEMETAPPSDHPPPPDAAKVEDVVKAALDDPPSGLQTVGGEELRRRTLRLARLRGDYERFSAIAIPETAVDARIAERRLDWTSVSGAELSFDLEGAARETRLRVVHDGGTLAQVAGMLGQEPVHRELELGTAPGELGSELLVAGKGDLIGPWREDERWRVLEIDSRLEPGSSPDGRERARQELLTELVERLAAGKVGVLGTF